MKVAVYKNLNTGKWSVASVKKTRNGFRKDKLIKQHNTGIRSLAVQNSGLDLRQEIDQGKEPDRQRVKLL
jgi:hypothetical protein